MFSVGRGWEEIYSRLKAEHSQTQEVWNGKNVCVKKKSFCRAG